MGAENQVLFREEQLLRENPGVLTVAIGISLSGALVTILMAGIVISGNADVIPPLLIFTTLIGGALYSIWNAILITEVCQDGFYVAYPPRYQIFLHIHPNDIIQYRICDFSTVRGKYLYFTGKQRRNTRWYSITNSGRGVHFELHSGKRVFVGTQRPQALAAALQQMMNVSN